MGIFDSLFGSKSKSGQSTSTTQSSSSTGTATGTESQTTSGSKTGAATSEQTVQNQQKTNLLDEQTKSILQGLVAQLAGGVGPGGTSLPGELQDTPGDILNFAEVLKARAGGAEAALGADTAAILSEARRAGTNQIQLNTRQAAEGAGSNLNSIVQAATASGEADLESRLAALGAELNFKNREISTNELLSAFGALTEGAKTGADITLAGQGQGVANIAGLSDILKGATAETTGTQKATGATTSEETFNQLVQLIRQATESGTTSGVQSGTANVSSKQTPGLLQTVFGLF